MSHYIKEPEIIEQICSFFHKAELMSNWGIEYIPQNYCYFVHVREPNKRNHVICVDKLQKRGLTITPYNGIINCDITPDYLTPFSKNKII